MVHFLEEILQRADPFIRQLKGIAAADQDLASVMEGTPLDLIDSFEAEHLAFLQERKESIIAAATTEDERNWLEFIKLALIYFSVLKDRIQAVRASSVKLAETLLSQHTHELEQLKTAYEQASQQDYDRKIEPYLHWLHEVSDASLLSEHLTWLALKNTLPDIRTHYALHRKYSGNRLVGFFQENDAAFIRRVKWEKLGGDEIGYLALARLHQIANSETSSAKTGARDALTKLVSERVAQERDLFTFHELALKQELIKLALHAAMHPKKKTIWLGTAEVVCHYRDAHPGEGMYLNCGYQWSWALNRFWLQAAMRMGYNFQLIEQHSPRVKKTMAGTAVNIVLLMLHKILPNKSHTQHLTTSQYDGGTEPTATLQEILFLKSMGCVAKTSQNGTLFLRNPRVKKCKSLDLSLPVARLKVLMEEAASQEAPAGGEQATPLPPLPAGWLPTSYFGCPKAVVELAEEARTEKVGGAYLLNALQTLREGAVLESTEVVTNPTENTSARLLACK